MSDESTPRQRLLRRFPEARLVAIRIPDYRTSYRVELYPDGRQLPAWRTFSAANAWRLADLLAE